LTPARFKLELKDGSLQKELAKRRKAMRWKITTESKE